MALPTTTNQPRLLRRPAVVHMIANITEKDKVYFLATISVGGLIVVAFTKNYREIASQKSNNQYNIGHYTTHPHRRRWTHKLQTCLQWYRWWCLLKRSSWNWCLGCRRRRYLDDASELNKKSRNITSSWYYTINNIKYTQYQYSRLSSLLIYTMIKLFVSCQACAPTIVIVI